MSSPPHRRLAVAGVTVLVLAVGAWWLTHPRAYAQTGLRLSVAAVAGQPVLVGLPFPDGEVVLRDAEVLVASDETDAEVRTVVCRADEYLGTARSTAEQWCEEVRSVGGQRLRNPRLVSGLEQLVVEVTPRTAGRVVLSGVEIAYRQGLRWGTNTADLHLVVEVAPRAG